MAYQNPFGLQRSPRRRRSRASALVVAALATVALAWPSTAASAAPILLSQGRPATASSVENPDYTPAAGAFDGNLDTRWASAWGSDDQWLQVDLGAVGTIERVELDWEGAYATAYEIQVSENGATGWSTIYSTATGAGGDETVPVSGQAATCGCRASTARSRATATRCGSSASSGPPAGPGRPIRPRTRRTPRPTPADP